MNLLLMCNKCESCSDKDVFLNYNKNSSKNSLMHHKVEISKKEIISNDYSINNLEIIDYPYSFNFNNNFTPLNSNNYNIKIPQNDYYLNNITKVEKLPNNQFDNSTINDKDSMNSLNSSSLIINNDESFLKNKALLSNYYTNYENLKNRNLKIKLIPNKKVKTSKKISKKIRLNIDVGKNSSHIFKDKRAIKSSSQIFKMKKNNKEIKVAKTVSDEYQKVKKCKTNIIMNTNDSKKKTNNILNKKNILGRVNYIKNKNYISFNEPKNKERKNKLDLNGIKKIFKGNIFCKNYSFKKNKLSKKKVSFLPKRQFSNSSKGNNCLLINKNIIKSYRNTTTNKLDNKKININFSYLLINNRDNHSLSKSYINPFDKLKFKKNKKLNIVI